VTRTEGPIPPTVTGAPRPEVMSEMTIMIVVGWTSEIRSPLIVKAQMNALAMVTMPHVARVDGTTRGKTIMLAIHQVSVQKMGAEIQLAKAIGPVTATSASEKGDPTTTGAIKVGVTVLNGPAPARMFLVNW
jgi:hypothetical protein